MREYTFKPAPVRKAQTWAIKDDHLMRRGAAQAIKLADVKSASWNSVTYRGTRSAWLHLQSESGTTKIEHTDGGGSREEFLALIHAVAEALGRVNPGVPIKYDYSAPWRIALFVLGVAGTLFGLFLIYVGLTGRGAIEATVAGGAMCILLFPVAWTCRPNLKSVTGDPASLVALIEGLGGAPMPDPEPDPEQT